MFFIIVRIQQFIALPWPIQHIFSAMLKVRSKKHYQVNTKKSLVFHVYIRINLIK
jgi:hypothetical protein